MRVITAIVCGVMREAPSPCTARDRMSIVMSPANPDQAEARVKTTSPAKYSFFGPNRSPSRPVMSNGTAYASR